MAMCELGCTEHYGCRLRLKGVQVSPKATPNRNVDKPVFREARADSWGKADARDDRGLPILRPNGTRLSLKEFSERRHSINDSFAAKDATSIHPISATRSS